MSPTNSPVSTSTIPTQPAKSAKPIVKWAGGKRRLLPELRARVPVFDRYIEPFAGGAALFFDLAPSDAILCDSNADLIDLYRVTRDRLSELLVELRYHAAAHRSRPEQHFDYVKQRFNTTKSRAPYDVVRSAQMVYLIKTCFNGMWRVNRSGGFNVPFGDMKNPTICDDDALSAASALLQHCDMFCMNTLEDLPKIECRAGDFVYFDPPYDPVSKTASFTSYTKAGFGLPHHKRLAELASTIADSGACVMLSLSDTALMRELYEAPGSRWNVDRVSARRSISCKGKSREAVTELIVRSYT